MAPTETSALKFPFSAETDAAKHIVARRVSVEEATQGRGGGSDVTITTLISAGNNCSILNSANIFYICLLSSKSFVEAPAEITPSMILGPELEENLAPLVIGPVMLSLVHQTMTQQQATLGDLSVTTVEMEHIPPVQVAPKPSGDQPEPEVKSSLIQLTPLASLATELVTDLEPPVKR